MRIVFSLLGDTLIDRSFERKLVAVKDMRPAWNEFADYFQQIETQQFATEGASGGQSWSPLSPDYAAWKIRTHPDKPILQFSGDLMDSLTEQPFGVDRREPTEMWMGTSVPYAIYHQKGTDKMPARPPVVFTENMKRQLTKIIQRHIMESDL